MISERVFKRMSQSLNQQILATVVKADFRKVEAASIKMRVQFSSVDTKRIFVRCFSSVQLNSNFISNIAPHRLQRELIEQVESSIKADCQSIKQLLDKTIDWAEVLFKQYGITTPASYDIEPFDLEVGVITSIGRHYLEILGKLDQLMPLLQTLEILEIVSSRELDQKRKDLKRRVRAVASSTRNFALGLRKRIKEAYPEESEASAAITSADSLIEGEVLTEAHDLPDDECSNERQEHPESKEERVIAEKSTPAATADD